MPYQTLLDIAKRNGSDALTERRDYDALHFHIEWSYQFILNDDVTPEDILAIERWPESPAFQELT